MFEEDYRRRALDADTSEYAPIARIVDSRAARPRHSPERKQAAVPQLEVSLDTP